MDRCLSIHLGWGLSGVELPGERMSAPLLVADALEVPDVWFDGVPAPGDGARVAAMLAHCSSKESRLPGLATRSAALERPRSVGVKLASMILRIWRGWTTRENAAAYEHIVSTEVLPGIAARGIAGYGGAFLLRRALDDGSVEFATIMQFESLAAVRAFAGDDYEAAYVPPRAQAVLSRFDARSAHYDVLMSPQGG